VLNDSKPYYNENVLLKELKAGESKAFLELYNRYHPGLYRYVLRFIKVPALAEDVLQDVFLKIWEIRKTINPDLSFQAYLYRISRNCVFKLIKKITSDESLRMKVMQQLQKSVTGADIKMQWKEYEELFDHAIAQLPPQRQKVFRLCREEGKTYEQAAAELGISRNTVKEHMVMAMKFVKEQFQHYDISLGLILLFYCR
jgi:RNA polymerase sigma-70 factor (family 1)